MPEENKEKTQKKRWTLKKVKTRCRTIYWQNFLLTASVVMLTLALLGSAFFALTYSYAIDERSEQMQSKATVVSHMVSSYMENGSLTGLRELADFASNVTDAEFLICNSDGNLLLTTDLPLAEIAGEAGFRDCNNISRIFKKFMGCSPIEYRQRRSAGK